MLFSEITGQDRVKERLIRTVLDQRVSHAQLFLGPEGSGTLALAIAYAQFINCKERLKSADNTLTDSCGTCPSCVKFNHLTHPDLHFIYPVATTKSVSKKPQSKDFIMQWRDTLVKSNYLLSLSDWYAASGIEKKQGIINAEDCSEILSTLSYKSYESEYKIMIMWSVERLFHAAAPKILKILEEPPDKTLFLLIAESQDRILNTILSRTQIVNIPKLANDDVRSYLTGKLGATKEEAGQVAVLANGNLLQAVKLLQSREEYQERFNLFVKWMRLCYSAKVFELNEFVNEVGRMGREKIKQFLNYASGLMRNAMILNNQANDTLVAGKEEIEFLKNFAPFITNRNIPAIASLLNQGEYHIDRNANPQITLMHISLQINQLLKNPST